MHDYYERLWPQLRLRISTATARKRLRTKLENRQVSGVTASKVYFGVAHENVCENSLL